MYIWTESDTKKLVELAEEHVGLLGEGWGYKPQFYNLAEGILAPLTTKGATKTADSICNKWFSLKKELSCVDQLMNASGLGFDVQCGLKITDANRHIWDAFLKSKPKDVKSTYNRLASDGWRWYDSITAILPSRAKGTHIFRASQAQSAKISSASKDRMGVDAEGNDGGEDGEDKGDEEGAEREAIERKAVVSARKDKGKSGSESGTFASVSITSSGKRKYLAVDSTSVISATPSKALRSSGTAAINGVKEQMQRMADNKEQRDTKRNDFRYRFLNIVESAFTGSVSGGGSSNNASSSSSQHVEPLNTRSQAIRMAGQIKTQLNDEKKIAFIDMLRADNVLIGDYLDMATQGKNLCIMWVDKLLKDFTAFLSN
ncbi:hypothetical protein SERLA73DRAFT_151817 [Serpula lacrymans var. lacrymans S7.3]|uniref:Myb/SANT-like domain-containing protein n=2 Tax=Serpula lacrymans var. lacrymans TaxID=341189 RepID=F8PST4_SERL3|nr:uncharacterized protein SERLADRAFT_407587 [Serpula lacrymans var. lacrymans S7.9]EGO01362.1 hypothetical protein SERLA73DRAFT_151817 [Serpula lacrymans var. lacrymans S7.3]EGO27001.1 hypothetical protein SERLADRAFT_407587 [Serpula lacrymans var. lacrymans S7.9]